MTESSSSAETPAGDYWAPDLPLLHPAMLLPRSQPRSRAFPFDHPEVQFVYFARNAIYALAQQYGLAGAEVLVPAYFHGVEVEALVAAGVRPRFFPVRKGMRVEPDDILGAIGPQTRAVYLIHYLGFPGPAEDVQRICRERGLLFIEDCALALLSKLGDRPLGSFGDAAVFCLYKTLPTPDGGALVCKDNRVRIDGTSPRSLGTTVDTALSLLTALETRTGSLGRGLARVVKAAGKAVLRPAQDESQRAAVGTQDFNPDEAKLLMSGVSRTVLAAQDFDSIVQARRRNYLHLESLLRDVSPAIFPGLPEGVCPLFYPFATPRKAALWSALCTKGVHAVLFWLPRQFAPPRGEFPEVDELRESVLELPCHQDMRPRDIERMAGVVRTAVREIGY